MKEGYMLITVKKSPYYKAEYKHHEIIEPDDDCIPPIFDYSIERNLSRFEHDFKAKSDDEAIYIAEKHADGIYKEKRESLPRGKKSLADRPVMVKLFEIRPPRRIKQT